MSEVAAKPVKGPDMRVTVAGVELCSPVIAASGTFGYGVEFEELVDFAKIGAFVTKGLSREPMAGNPTPRIIETSAGMMNAIGLQNMGVRAFAEGKMPRLREIAGAVTIANVFGFTLADCCEVIRQLNDTPGIAMYELNASCPNTAHGGMVFGTDARMLEELVHRTERISQRPLMVKLSPNVTSIATMAKVAEDDGGAGGFAGQHVSGHGDRSLRRAGRKIANVTAGTERAGDQADRGADGVRGGSGGKDTRGGDGWDSAGGGRGGVPAGGGDGGAGGDG